MTLDPQERVKLKVRAHVLIDAATTEFKAGAITAPDWQRRVAGILARAYLRDDDPRWQSGFDGDEALWRDARSLILAAAPATGSFLDVGCATGHLIESLDSWAAERGQALTFYGLELNQSLADEARRRLPRLAERIFTGNVSDWTPPRRFAAVRTGLEYAPPGEEAELLERLAAHFIEPRGRILVGPVIDDAAEPTRAAFVAAGFPCIEIVSVADRNAKMRHVVWAA